jgi:hypothetical protein
MSKSKLRYLFSVIMAATFLVAIPHHSQAVTETKHNATQQVEKERLVLMPLRVPDEDKNLTGAMETALVKGLQQKYDVYSGEQVSQKAHEIFMKESRNTAHKECDETKCMQNIAMAFQAELIATANVTKQDGIYYLALSIQNIFDNKVVYSESLPCKNCDGAQVVEKLKELSGTSITVTTAPAVEEAQAKLNLSDSETALWNEVKTTNTIDDYQTYLAQYPKGNYLALANSRIKKLQDLEVTGTQKLQDRAAAQQDQSTWDSANKTASEASYTEYLNLYPQGQYTTLAAERISKLKNAKLKAASDQPYEISTDGAEVTDYRTGLIWRRCAEGMVYSGGTCTGTASEFTYDGALQHAKSESRRTGIAWRLPEKDELEGIVNKKFKPMIDPTAFPAQPNSFFGGSAFWSASTSWEVSFSSAGSSGYEKFNYSYYVRLVRTGQ